MKKGKNIKVIYLLKRFFFTQILLHICPIRRVQIFFAKRIFSFIADHNVLVAAFFSDARCLPRKCNQPFFLMYKWRRRTHYLCADDDAVRPLDSGICFVLNTHTKNIGILGARPTFSLPFGVCFVESNCLCKKYNKKELPSGAGTFAYNAAHAVHKVILSIYSERTCKFTSFCTLNSPFFAKQIHLLSANKIHTFAETAKISYFYWI